LFLKIKAELKIQWKKKQKNPTTCSINEQIHLHIKNNTSTFNNITGSPS